MSAESCDTALDCGCGEFCSSVKKQCQLALCYAGKENPTISKRFKNTTYDSLITDNDCQSYPEYSKTFTCRNNRCMPPQNILAKAFEKQFDNENVLGAKNPANTANQNTQNSPAKAPKNPKGAKKTPSNLKGPKIPKAQPNIIKNLKTTKAQNRIKNVKGPKTGKIG